jgi:glycogen debranching enzyme
MADVHVTEQYEIVAEADRPAAPSRVLKHDDTFAVFNLRGDMIPSEAGEHGLFHDGTRFLSRFELLLGRRQPLLLNSMVSDDNVTFTADLTNLDVRPEGRPVLTRGEIHVFRSRLLVDGGCVERIRISNFALHTVDLPLALAFDADFADIFEVRGTPRHERGTRLPDACGPGCVLRYVGLDRVERRTQIRWSREAASVDPGLVRFAIRLEPHESTTFDLTITCETGTESRRAPSYESAQQVCEDVLRALAVRASVVVASDDRLERWLRRSSADLQMMLTETRSGLYPYAGIPWFSTPFGRDGLITAFELLWAVPAVASGVLTFLADTQATSYSDAQDAQPGKILHEMRGGEMAALGEVPFGRYYGSVDATPLFVMLADAYFLRTGDRSLIDRLWPNILAALEWMRSSGDPDGDGFLEYARRSASGLIQQGWKDSHDSVFHQDGVLAQPPIALCEVQGYAFGAWRGAARLAAMRGDAEAAATYEAHGESLRRRFEDAFWCEDLGTYAIALDRDKQPCRIRSSNAGHCLFAGIASAERARRVVEGLMGEDSFSGWGVRTIAAGQPRYNPMSYHNGSLWPHDNALVAAGCSRYGFTREASRIFEALFGLSQAVDLHRLPELICGFRKRGREHPTLYPVACAPQAWAAGAVYLLLQASLGLHVDAIERRISFSRAVLPVVVGAFRILNLQVGDASVDLQIEAHPHDVGITVLRRTGVVDVVALK